MLLNFGQNYYLLLMYASFSLLFFLIRKKIVSNDAEFRLSLLVNLPYLLRFLQIMVSSGCVPLISKIPEMTF